MLSTVSLVAAVCLLVVCIFTTRHVDAQMYAIVPQRIDGANLLSLTCRSNNASSNFATQDIALFFRNKTLFVQSLPENSQTHRFVVDRFSDEGNYSCGASVPDSNEVPVIGYPTANFQVEFDGVTTIRARAGTTAILSPYIRTGNWHSRYYIDWYNDGEMVGRIDGLRPPPLFNFKFRVDPSNFSLMIESVSRAESGRYFGVLGVTEGRGSLLRTFRQTQMMAIVLEVYEAPTATLERDEIVVTSADNSRPEVEFKCTGSGYPNPTIYWRHNFKSHEFTTDQTTANGTGVVGTLTLLSAHPEHSGKVGCYVVVKPGGNVAPLHSEQAVANLSVLQIFDVDRYKTTGGELVFIVDLGNNVMVPTGLRVRLEKEGELISMSDVFQRNPITYVFGAPANELFSSSLNVRISNSKSEIISEPFAVDLSPLNDKTCSFNQQVVTVVVPVVAGLIVIIGVFGTICYLLHNMEIHRRCKMLNSMIDNENYTDKERREAAGYLLHYLKSGGLICGKKPVTEPSQQNNSKDKNDIEMKYSDTGTQHEDKNGGAKNQQARSDSSTTNGISMTSNSGDAQLGGPPNPAENQQAHSDSSITIDNLVTRSKGRDDQSTKMMRKRKKYSYKGCTEEEAISLTKDYFGF